MNELPSRIEQEIPNLRRFARALLRHAGQADALVRETLERALARAEVGQPPARLRPWLFRIQHDAFVSRTQRFGHNPAGEWPHGAPTGVEGKAGCRHEPLTLQDALDLLPTEQRIVLLLVSLEGLSYEEVAEVVSAPVGTVRSRLCRGREALRTALVGLASPPAVGEGAR